VERITAEIARRFSPPDPPEDPEHSQPEENLSKEEAPEVSQPTFPPSKRGLSWEEAVILLVSIPGMSDRAAFGILAEIGVNMQQFPTASHLASWAGVCPGNHESAGKRLSGKTRKGNRLYASPLLASRSCGCTPEAWGSHRPISPHCRPTREKTCGMAVAHSLLVSISHLLDEGVSSEEHAEAFFEERDRQGAEKRLVRQLSRLGYHVELQPVALAG